MPGVELRAGRAPCVLSRRRHAELGGTGRDRQRPRRWFFGLLRLRHGGKRGAILGVDNTFATPLNQRPLTLGADVAMQSATKFIGGHSDLLSGVVTVRDANLLAALRQARELAGATPGTLETFLAVRGART